MIGVCCLLLSLFFLTGISQATYADQLTKKQLRLQKIYQEIKAQKEKIQAVKKKETGALNTLLHVRSDLKRTRAQLQTIKQKLSFNEQRLVRVRDQLSEAQTQYDTQMARFLSRLAEFYKSGQVNHLELILGAKDMSEFTDRTYYFGKIIEHDAALVDQLRRYRAFIGKKEEEIVSLTDEMRGLSHLIVNKQQAIAEKEKQKRQLYGSLKQERQQYEKQLAEKRAASNELEAIIRGILAQTKGEVTTKVTGSFQWPISGSLSSYFGTRRHPLWGGSDFHTGIDIVSPYGRAIGAADGGKVVYSGWWDGYGKAVVINHGGGKSTVYAHMSRIFLKKGQTATKGQTVGLVGSTGYSTGPHLHFEVRVNGKPKNPLTYLP